MPIIRPPNYSWNINATVRLRDQAAARSQAARRAVETVAGRYGVTGQTLLERSAMPDYDARMKADAASAAAAASASRKATLSFENLNAIMTKAAGAAIVLGTGIKLITGEMAAGAKLSAASAAEARGELSKALSYRMQTPTGGLRFLAAMPFLGGAARGVHEARMFRAGMPERVEVAQMLEQQWRSTVGLMNQQRVQNVAYGLQAQFTTPATQQFQQRMLAVKAGPEAQVAAYQAEVAQVQRQLGDEREKLRRARDPIRVSEMELDETAIATKIEGLKERRKLLGKQAADYDRIWVGAERSKYEIGKLWHKEFYMGMAPQVATHWGAFGFGEMPTQPPEVDPQVSTLVLIHQVLMEINKKFPPGKQV